MPELPDLAVVADALHAALAGRHVLAVRAPAPLAVRATPEALAALTGLRLHRVDRRGKFLRFGLTETEIAINPMLTGRLQLATPGAKLPRATAMIMTWGPRSAGPTDAAGWLRGAPWLPADDADVEVRYRDPSQMGKVYLLAREGPGTAPGLDGSQGPDADDPALTLDLWRERIRRHPGELKALLRNQSFVAGIGNAYSDEILHVAGLSPFRRRATLAAEEIDTLHAATRSVLAGSIDVLRMRVPPTFETQVRDHLAVHLRGGQACPRCGARLSQLASRGETTTWCRACQP